MSASALGISDPHCSSNARLETLRHRIAGGVAALNPDSELDALDWIEGVAEFDDGDEVL